LIVELDAVAAAAGGTTIYTDSGLGVLLVEDQQTLMLGIFCRIGIPKLSL